MVLVGTPINTLTASLQGVLFAASSRAQSDPAQLKKGYLAATAMIGLMSLPLAATVASVPETVVTAIYGKQWLAAIPVLAPLALAMALHALLAVVGPVLMAQNKVGLELRAQLFTLCLMIPLLYVTAQHSLQAVAWGVMGIYFTRWILLVDAILTSLNARWVEILKILRWPFLCAMISAMLTFICNQETHGISPLLQLIADMTTACLTLLVLLRLFGKQIIAGTHGDYLLASGRLPVSLRRFLDI
jgi:PST family polysaccharide transporter